MNTRYGDDPLTDFDLGEFTHDGATRAVFRTGTGPAVIVIAEVPGITPRVADFARRVAAIGCTAVMPHMFGTPGLDPDPKVRGKIGSVQAMLSTIAPACVSREFVVLATGRTSPIVAWLRALAALEHERCGGPGVGAVGMCWTGGYALAMAVDDRMVAPVLSQPSMPIAVTSAQKSSIDISADDLAVVRRRCTEDGLEVLGLRFCGDRFVPPERFHFLRDQLGDSFLAVELPDESARPDAATPPHSVLTEHLVDIPGEPTRQALDQVLTFLTDRLQVS